MLLSRRRKWEGIELLACLSPSREVFIHKYDEALVVFRCNQMRHFVYQHVLQQVPWLFDQFGVQADMPARMITTSPAGFHAL